MLGGHLASQRRRRAAAIVQVDGSAKTPAPIDTAAPLLSLAGTLAPSGLAAPGKSRPASLVLPPRGLDSGRPWTAELASAPEAERRTRWGSQ